MKQHFIRGIACLFCIISINVLAQKSPIQLINNTCNVNIDTTFKIGNFGQNHYGNYRSGGTLRFTFKNIGEHVTFVDSVSRDFSQNQYITKPGDTSTMLVFSNIDYVNVLKKRDTTITFSVPFYYGGKIIRENLSYHLTFGKSKLIDYDNLQVDVTKFVEDTIVNKPSLVFTYYFTVRNKSKQPIYCTKEFLTYNDSGNDLGRYNANKYTKILPGEAYKIPVKMNMDRKYRFKREGWIEVFSAETYEMFKCSIISTFEQKAN